ncbi:MAG: hypothetical protein QG595_1770 [Pseudomonadota bacterium]|nr:hypothetical protein [Pseudomonadota bacterium]
MAALVAISMFHVGSAQAMPVSYSTTFNGSINVTTGAGANTALPVPGSDFYGNTFAAPTLNFTAPAAATGFGFYDDFIFTIPVGAGTNSVTSSISIPGSLQISGLQSRLFALPLGYTGGALGACPGGCLAVWGAEVLAANVTYTVLNPTLLGPGSYVLQIRGDATGAFGGSYSGVLNLTAIPVPAAVWLFGSALGGLGLLKRRRVAD